MAAEDAPVLDRSAVLCHVESLLKHIEDNGGEFQQGREALERLKESLPPEPQRGEVLTPSTDTTSNVSVMEQMRRIRETLDRVEAKIATMSDESLDIVSSSVAEGMQLP